MITLYRRHPWLVAAFLLAALVALDLTGRFVHLVATRWTASAAMTVEGWMTPRYVVHAFGLPRDDLAKVLGLTEDDTPFMSLNDLAAERSMEPAALIAEVQAVVAAARGAAP